MKLVHTADWHLGRVLYDKSLLEDQKHILHQISEIITRENPDLVVIAGDIFDRTLPSSEAVSLLSTFLENIILNTPARIVIISGNHDGAERLEFASRILAKNRLHFVGSLSENSVIPMNCDGSSYSIYAVPYLDIPDLNRRICGKAQNHSEALLEALRFCKGKEQEQGLEPSRRILVSHAFVSGCSQSESERPLSIGGADQVDSNCFNEFEFSYVALGHLHRHQRAGAANIRYSGSPLKYSFSEVNHTKSISIVEFNGEGQAKIRQEPLNPLRNLQILEGSFQEILEYNPTESEKQDFILARITDSKIIINAMSQLRTVFPNAVAIESLKTSSMFSKHLRKDYLKLTDFELFSQFYKYVTDEELTSDQEQLLQEVLGEVDSE